LGDAHFLEPKFVELYIYTSLKGQRVTFWRPFGRQPFLGARGLHFGLLFRPPGQPCRTPPRGRRNPAHNIPEIDSCNSPVGEHNSIICCEFDSLRHFPIYNYFDSQNSTFHVHCFSSQSFSEQLPRGEHLEPDDTFTGSFEYFPSANNCLYPPIDPSYTFPGLDPGYSQPNFEPCNLQFPVAPDNPTAVELAPGAGYSQPTFELCNLQFPVAPDNPASAELAPGATFSDLSSLPPRNPALDATLNPQLLLTIGDVQLQGEESVVGSPNPTPSSPPGASPSSLSTTIRCAWPSCEKDFKSRSDYKYVEPSPFESSIELS